MKCFLDELLCLKYIKKTWCGFENTIALSDCGHRTRLCRADTSMKEDTGFPSIMCSFHRAHCKARYPPSSSLLIHSWWSVILQTLVKVSSQELKLLMSNRCITVSKFTHSSLRVFISLLGLIISQIFLKSLYMHWRCSKFWECSHKAEENTFPTKQTSKGGRQWWMRKQINTSKFQSLSSPMSLGLGFLPAKPGLKWYWPQYKWHTGCSRHSTLQRETAKPTASHHFYIRHPYLCTALPVQLYRMKNQ